MELSPGFEGSRLDSCLNEGRESWRPVSAGGAGVGPESSPSSSVFQVKIKMLHFLRCAALFFHVYTDVPLPSGVVDGDNIESLFVGLTAYLGLPSTLTEIVRVPGTRELIDR